MTEAERLERDRTLFREGQENRDRVWRKWLDALLVEFRGDHFRHYVAKISPPPDHQIAVAEETIRKAMRRLAGRPGLPDENQ
jgi:hypothetical protein